MDTQDQNKDKAESQSNTQDQNKAQDPRADMAGNGAGRPDRKGNPAGRMGGFRAGYPYRSRRRGGVIFALVVIVFGALILASNIGASGAALSTYRPIIFSWPMLVVVIGLVGLASHRRFSFSHLFIILAGFFFLILRIGANGMTLFGWQIPDGFAATYWPVLLIAAGVLWLIFWVVRPRNFYVKRRWERDGQWEQGESFAGGSQWGYRGRCGERGRRFSQYTHQSFKNGEANSVFGSGKHTILDPAFEGGEVNAVFGEVTLDLRKAGLPEGKTAVLEVNVVFGNAVIIVPETWNVELRANPVIGSFVDKRDNPEGPHDMTRTLEIRVSSVFSGGELRN